MKNRRERLVGHRQRRDFRLRAALLPMLVLGGFALSPAGAGAVEPRFSDGTARLGIDFTHRHFGTGEKYMPENMAPGVVVLDYDDDGLLDLYLVQGRPLVGAPPADGSAVNRLLRQTPAGTFLDVTERSGAGDGGYGMGASFGDYDRDGDVDLYVANFGPNALLRNRGDGTFENVAAAAGVECPLWSVSSGFFDPDGDGDLDLYVANYLDFAFDNHKFCGNAQTGVRAYCHPDVYNSQPDCFYRNNGDGTFSEVGREVGIVPTADGVGLGVAFADLDGDGNQDIYVANDATMNYLYLGDGTGRFNESALLAGVGFNGAGQAESSMGVEIGDLDGDGLPEIFLTHLDEQTNTLYHNLGQGLFVDGTEGAGLGAPSLPWVGFGTVFFDHDNDGDLDIFVTNGHIIDNIELFDATRAWRQPTQLYDNLGDGRFVEVSEALQIEERLVGRGAAAGDLDRDGDLDVVFMQNDGPTWVLVNAIGSRAGTLGVQLVGTVSNPQGFGARLELEVGDRWLMRLAHSSTSYASQSPAEVWFGLGAAMQAEALLIRWPTGRSSRFVDLAADWLYRIYESGAGVSPDAAQITAAESNR